MTVQARSALAIALHDGFYCAGTGAGRSNRAFIQIVTENLAPHVLLTVLPIRLTSRSTEYDPAWHQQTLRILGQHAAHIRPVDNGTNGRVRFGGLPAFRHLAADTAAQLRQMLPSTPRLAIILLDVPFLGVPPMLPTALLPAVTVLPRSTALLHQPDDLDRIRFERTGLLTVAHNGGHIAAISTHMRTHLHHAYRIPTTALIDLPNGLTPADRCFGQPDRELLPAAAHAGFILAIGRAQPYKGWDDLLDALAHLRATGIQTPHAVLAAVTEQDTPSAYQRHLADRITHLNINATLLTRHNPALRDLLTHPQLRALVIPSRTEPFGRLPLESYAAGAAPVIATTAGGLAEQVINGITGITAHPNNPHSLADAIRRALDLTEPDRRAMRTAGRAMLSTHFDYPKTVTTFLTRIAPWTLNPS